MTLEDLIATVLWLDKTGLGYVLMFACFLAMAALHNIQTKENARLRLLLKQAMRLERKQ